MDRPNEIGNPAQDHPVGGRMRAMFDKGRLWPALLLGMLCAFALTARAQEHSFLPASEWGLILPEGFARQDQPIAHFSHPDRAYIVIQTLYESLDDQGLGPVGSILGEGAQAIRIDAFDELQTATGRMLLWTGQNMASGDVALMAFADGPNGIASMTAIVAAGSGIGPGSLRQSLASIALRDVPDDEYLAIFPVLVRDLGGFAIARGGPDTIVLTPTGSFNGTLRYEGSSISILALERHPQERLMIPDTIALMRDFVAARFPDARQTGDDIIQTGLGQAVVTQFVFTQPTGRVMQGKTITMLSRCCRIIAVGAFAPEDTDAEARFQRVWQSVRSRN